MMMLHDVPFGTCSKMESLPEEMLFTIFQNFDPLELIYLSRVNKHWHNLALSPRLHRSVDFQQKKHLSSSAICHYISKFKHSLQELHLQECYWLKGVELSSALQKCRKLTSLNVLGCNVTKKTLCSVLNQNQNLKTLLWSISSKDLYLPPRPISRETFRVLLQSFCDGLATAFAGLDHLTLRFPVFVHKFKIFVPFVLNLGMPVICSKLCLKKFAVQWFDVAERAIQCVEIVIEGNALQFPQKELTVFLSNEAPLGRHHLTSLQAMTMKTAATELERGTLRTFLLPYFMFIMPDNCDKQMKAFATKSSIVNMDLGVLSLQEPDSLMPILSAQQSLRYLNLTGLVINGHMLQVIASSSPNLECLNLQDCRECLTPIQGLESLSLCCTNLVQLNLKGVHYGQEPGERLASLMEILSKFTNLVSLSLCNCVLGSSGENKSSNGCLLGDLFKSNKRVSKNPRSRRSGGQSASSSASVDDVETFDDLVKRCSKITEFELIRTSSLGINFSKSYYDRRGHGLPSQRFVEKCHAVRNTYDTMMSIADWKNLQRLTLAAPFMEGCLDVLITITRSCPNLQFLSLATLSNLSHSGNVAYLEGALSHCRQLRDFRLEQPFFKITESFMWVLGKSKHLERVCVIAREGPMQIDSDIICSLFEKCPKLIYFQVLCDVTIKASKMMMDSVKERFLEERPGLIVSIVTFRQGTSRNTCQVQIVKTVPVVHLKEVFLFGTSVATTVPT